VMNGLAGAACAVIFLYSAAYVVECVGRNVNDVRAVTVPKAVLFIIIPVGSFFLTLQFLRTVWQRYKKAET
jgi:TRAP-type C4-dicarboxylate transport system permease small subunit